MAPEATGKGKERVLRSTANIAASYAILGKLDEAKPYVAETLRLNSSFTVKWMREHAVDIPLRNEGLRKAGLKEE
jgi:hypothetical protein